jgi:hypothetical protein
MVEVGYGYTVPPAGRLLPPVRPWNPRIPPTSRAREFQLLAWANEARAELGGPAIDYLADLFQGDQTFVCTLAELDPYAAWRSEPTAAPLVPRIRCGPAFSERTGPEIFTYMHANHPRLRDVLAGLSSSGREAAVYVSGAPAEQVARLCGRNVRVLRRPADYTKVLPQAKLAVHHGGLGTAHTALAAGTPQIMFAHRLEWQVNARGVEMLGAGRQIPPDTGAEALGALFAAAADDAGLQAGALRAAARLRDAHGQDPLGLIAEVCEWRLGGAGAAAEAAPADPA